MVGFVLRNTMTGWPHQIERFCALLALCSEENPPVIGGFSSQRPVMTGGFPSERPVTRSFDIFFDLRLNKWLSKESRRRWCGMQSRHYDVTVMRWPGHTALFSTLSEMASRVERSSKYLCRWLVIARYNDWYNVVFLSYTNNIIEYYWVAYPLKTPTVHIV